MEGQPCGTNRVSKIERISHRIIKELGTGHKVNGRGIEEYEKTVWQEEKKPLRIKGWGQCVVRKQKYPIKSTLKEARPKVIQTF